VSPGKIVESLIECRRYGMNCFSPALTASIAYPTKADEKSGQVRGPNSTKLS